MAYSIEEVVEATSFSGATLYRPMEAEQLEFKKVGGRRIFMVPQLERLLGEAA